MPLFCICCKIFKYDSSRSFRLPIELFYCLAWVYTVQAAVWFMVNIVGSFDILFRFFSYFYDLHKCLVIYRTCAIITRGLYTFYPIFEGLKCFFTGAFFVKFWTYVWLVFKSGFKSRAGYSGVPTVICFSHLSNCNWWKNSYVFFLVVFLIQCQSLAPGMAYEINMSRYPHN